MAVQNHVWDSEKELFHTIKHNPHAHSQILASVGVFSFPFADRRLESRF